MNFKLKVIIIEYRDIIAKDGEVTTEQLKKWLKLDEEVPDEYKTPKGMDDLINKILKPIKPSRSEIMAQRMKLYNMGMTDEEIAKMQKLKSGAEAIKQWRKRFDLSPNGGTKTRSDIMIERMKLYKEGLSDGKIAEIQDCKKATITYWRCLNKLKMNGG